MLAKVGCILVALIPILGQYTILNLPLSLSEILIALYLIMIIIDKGLKKELKLFINKSYIILVYWMLISGFIVMIFYGDKVSIIEMLNGFLRIVFYLISLTIIIPYINNNDLFKYYYKISLVVIVLFFIQVVFYYTLNVRIRFIIPFLDLFLNKGITFSAKSMFRASSLFLEPSWLTIYILPIYVYVLFKKNNILMSIIVATTVILSTSSLGIILIIILTLCKFIFEGKMNVKKIILSISIIVFSFILLKTPYVENSISRLNTVGSSSSTMMRVYRGFNLYSQLDTTNKILGVSVGNLENFIEKNNYIDDKYYTEGSREFVGDILYIIITSGVIGGVLYIMFLLNLLLKSTFYLKMNIIVFITTAFVSPMLTNYTWLFYMFILFSIKLKESKNKEVRMIVI